MSNIVSGIAQRRVVGSSARKSVLMLMASCASDDGSGIWTSKANMALDLEMSRRTVQAAIADLIELGVVSEAGQRPCKNGYTVEYRINIDVLACMPCTRAADAPVQQVRMTRAAAAPLPVQELRINHPKNINEPSIQDPPCIPPAEKPPPKARLPADWALSDEGWAYARSQGIPEKVIEDEARGFHAYWTDRTDREARKSERGWEQCWAGWCRRIASRYSKGSPLPFGANNQRGQRGGNIACIAARRRAESEL